MKKIPILLSLLFACCLVVAPSLAEGGDSSTGTTYKTNSDGSLTVNVTTRLENGGLIDVEHNIPARKVKKWLQERAKESEDGEKPSKQVTDTDVQFLLIEGLEELMADLLFQDVKKIR